MPDTAAIEGIRDLAERYHGFIIDQWGVLHDGTTVYPDVHGVLAELQRRAKQMVLLSNTSRRVADNRRQLRGLGLNPGMFAGIVTSGEAAYLSLLHKRRPPFDRLGRRCLLLSHPGDTSPVDGLDLDLVDSVDEADFVFLAWYDRAAHPEDHFAAFAGRAIKRRLPLICANPDRLVRVVGGLIEAPGAYAARYTGAGGEVVYVGKPHAPIYAACLDLLEGLEKNEIVCIGDSLEHDIKGANDMGLDSALVAGGIHAEELLRTDGGLSLEKLPPLMLEHGAKPRYVLRRFGW